MLQGFTSKFWGRGSLLSTPSSFRIYFLLLFTAAAIPLSAQQVDPAAPNVVQPGAPGEPSKTLPPSTRARCLLVLPPTSSSCRA